MGEAQFWRLIGRIGRRGAVGPLVAALGRLSGEEILGFHERLRAVMAALDTPAHRVRPVADVSGGVPAPLSEDGFEDARLAVVAAGRERWAAAVADPAVLAGVWPLALGEALGQAAGKAYEQATGRPWPNLDLVTAAVAGLPPAARSGWLVLIPAHGAPGAYEDQLAGPALGRGTGTRAPGGGSSDRR